MSRTKRCCGLLTSSTLAVTTTSLFVPAYRRRATDAKNIEICDSRVPFRTVIQKTFRGGNGAEYEHAVTTCIRQLNFYAKHGHVGCHEEQLLPLTPRIAMPRVTAHAGDTCWHFSARRGAAVSLSATTQKIRLCIHDYVSA